MFFEGHAEPEDAVVHAGNAEVITGDFKPAVAVHFEGVVWVFEDLGVQEGFLLGWDSAFSSCAFERAEVVEVLVELEGVVDGGSADVVAGGGLVGRVFLVGDGVDDSLSEVGGVGFHVEISVVQTNQRTAVSTPF